mmetsp:Transcript_21375/g.59311  ORF Transcript_21375/g.59311 Transcript_21375/m.59311 type:complete len:569 (+) Transcript_21375:105-1811(+)|eukprot:CAMPEP_0117663904 /NCGR_PEP_ID=MMETSP0804-20121206/8883_1 /TAXON_ID=1074897 /ORGANISM="Tetraselmis astigmatica, Strain CCMP880" /LENGTH=568 /DNA_ID=CAMNT_0005470997 /DNA_START=210 /DNA_END=1916 /DNA_ORIENTATION=-
MGLPRLNSSDVLFVPPYDCVWLSGGNFQLENKQGCVVFEARGAHDATVILRDQPGIKRIEQALPPDSPARSYTIKFGSHRNSLLEVERNGTAVSSEKRADATMSSSRFMQFWVNYSDGTVTVGKDSPHIQNILHQWTDPRPGVDISHIGLSSWDSHVAYRSISVHPPLDFTNTQVPPAPLLPMPDAVASLQAIASVAVAQWLTPSTVCTVLHLLCQTTWPSACSSLYSQTVAYAAKSFSDVHRQDPAGLFSLPAVVFRQVAEHTDMGAPELELFQATVEWGNCGSSMGCEAIGTLTDLEQMLLCVRFPLMSVDDLRAVQEHPLAHQSKVLQGLLSEVDVGSAGKGLDLELDGRYLRRNTNCNSNAANRRQRRSKHSGGVTYELMYVSDGDDYGLCSFLGTAQGTQRFMNPCVEKRICVTCSGPAGKHCNANLLLSRKFSNILCAGPVYQEGSVVSWWRLDLADHQRLAVNYYTIRHDGSDNFPRNWVLEGSADHGSEWKLLQEHINDESITHPGQFCSWPVANKAKAFNAFRLRLSGANASSNPAESRRFHLSMLELYGTLFVDPAEG